MFGTINIIFHVFDYFVLFIAVRFIIITILVLYVPLGTLSYINVEYSEYSNDDWSKRIPPTSRLLQTYVVIVDVVGTPTAVLYRGISGVRFILQASVSQYWVLLCDGRSDQLL